MAFLITSSFRGQASFCRLYKKGLRPAVLIRLDQPKDAPYTLVEYGDYECPDYGRLYVALRELQSDIASRLVTAC